MSVTIEELQSFQEKDSIIHVRQDDGSLEELEVTIKAASVAGVAAKVKGKGDIKLFEVDKIEEIAAAPVKPKSVVKRKMAPVEEGKMRQHLADRHGIEFDWCKNATEEEAVAYHNSIDHAKLGHDHSKVEKPADERTEAIEAGAES